MAGGRPIALLTQLIKQQNKTSNILNVVKMHDLGEQTGTVRRQLLQIKLLRRFCPFPINLQLNNSL